MAADHHGMDGMSDDLLLNCKDAAALLGIDPKTLYRKILSYGISPDPPKP